MNTADPLTLSLLNYLALNSYLSYPTTENQTVILPNQNVFSNQVILQNNLLNQNLLNLETDKSKSAKNNLPKNQIILQTPTQNKSNIHPAQFFYLQANNITGLNQNANSRVRNNSGSTFIQLPTTAATTQKTKETKPAPAIIRHNRNATGTAKQDRQVPNDQMKQPVMQVIQQEQIQEYMKNSKVVTPIMINPNPITPILQPAIKVKKSKAANADQSQQQQQKITYINTVDLGVKPPKRTRKTNLGKRKLKEAQIEDLSSTKIAKKDKKAQSSRLVQTSPHILVQNKPEVSLREKRKEQLKKILNPKFHFATKNMIRYKRKCIDRKKVFFSGLKG